MAIFGRKKSSSQVETKEVGTSSETMTILENGTQRPIKTNSDGSRSPLPMTGSHLQRYYLRAIANILCPVILTTYWFVVWYVYISPADAGEVLSFGHNGGQYVFYSWFLIGIFGLGVAEYGMVGLEASMMMEKRWAAKNAMQVMMHADHSWAGPSGWVQVVMDMFVRGEKRPEPPTPLWCLLAFIIALPYVALPLTGLSMNLGTGYHATGKHPLVEGLQYDNFNVLSGSGFSAGLWKVGLPAVIPQMAAIFTAEGFDRSKSQNDAVKAFPNQLPNNTAGISDVFITPQASVPMVGRSFGLMLSYNCTAVTKLSDFTILNKRQKNMVIGADWKNNDWYYTDNTNSSWINLRNSTESGYADNYYGILEEGITEDMGYTFANDDADVPDNCYFWAHNNSHQYPGMETQTVYEALLWQWIDDSNGTNPITGEIIPYDLGLDGNITELYGQYKLDWGVDENNNTIFQSMSAIGARCTVSSAVGMADIDGTKSTYSNFQQGDTPITDATTCAPRMDQAAPYNVMDQAVVNDDGSDWIDNLFHSVNSPSPYAITVNQSVREELAEAFDLSPSDVPGSTNQQLSYFGMADLRDALLKTYPAYTNELMFNGGLGYQDKSGIHSVYFEHPNTTAYESKTIFQSNVLPQWVPGSMLIAWTFLTIIITAIYGFRRRWSVELDGYSMFRFGADLAERVRGRPEFGVNMPYEDCYLLKEIPGMIGDANVNYEPGHITLVHVDDELLADKGKKYM